MNKINQGERFVNGKMRVDAYDIIRFKESVYGITVKEQRNINSYVTETKLERRKINISFTKEKPWKI